MENKETFKVERGVPLPKVKSSIPKKESPFRVALKSMKIGDCITIDKCKTLVERGYIIPSNTYRQCAGYLWKEENCRASQRVFYDNDGDMGLQLWKVKR